MVYFFRKLFSFQLSVGKSFILTMSHVLLKFYNGGSFIGPRPWVNEEYHRTLLCDICNFHCDYGFIQHFYRAQGTVANQRTHSFFPLIYLFSPILPNYSMHSVLLFWCLLCVIFVSVSEMCESHGFSMFQRNIEFAKIWLQ